MIHLGVWALGPWFLRNTLKYLALPFIMRRALSSESGFLGFLDLGFGLLGSPSLRDHGSGLTDDLTRILNFVDGFEGNGFDRYGKTRLLQRKDDFSDSIFVSSVTFFFDFPQYGILSASRDKKDGKFSYFSSLELARWV